MNTWTIACSADREGTIPAKLVHQDADAVAFEDIDPQAPTHLLVVPRKHVPTANDLAPDDDALAGQALPGRGAARDGARDRGQGLAGDGQRRPGDAQSVFHVHLHVMGGRAMGWPPG